MNKFIFIIGGSRSGKSRYAQDLAKRLSREVAFVATCLPQDKEMARRIALHKKSRPRHWKVIEESRDIKSALTGLKRRFAVVIIDCLGLLMSNLMSGGLTEGAIKKEIKAVANLLAKRRLTYILVSNEVGCGLVSPNPAARSFQDLLGFANQELTKKADEVIVMQSGIPIKIKGGAKIAKIK